MAPATAAARRTARAPARAPARVAHPPRRRPRPAAPRRPARSAAPPRAANGATLAPRLAGALAGALAGLAESRLVVRLTRDRLWIPVIAALLVGIVALNVLALSFSASSTKVGQQADALQRQNSALRAEIADQLSNERIQSAIARLGFVVPEPAMIRYLEPGTNDAALAARRLESGELTLGVFAAPYVAPVVEVPDAAVPATDPAGIPEAETPSAPLADPEPAAPDDGGGGGGAGGVVAAP